MRAVQLLLESYTQCEEVGDDDEKSKTSSLLSSLLP